MDETPHDRPWVERYHRKQTTTRTAASRLRREYRIARSLLGELRAGATILVDAYTVKNQMAVPGLNRMLGNIEKAFAKDVLINSSFLDSALRHSSPDKGRLGGVSGLTLSAARLAAKKQTPSNSPLSGGELSELLPFTAKILPVYPHIWLVF